MKYLCAQQDCTVAVTGKCLLSHVPAETCPNIRIVDEASQGLPEQARGLQTALVYPGNELGFDQVSEIFASRYGHLIAVLGAEATGKTCLLCSLYLLASCGDLRPTRLFAGSLTLPGFESRLRLLRKWSGTGLPDKIVDRTTLLDPRQPGFLHLIFKENSGNDGIRDLFFTDLPGEWTTNLVKRAAVAERFRFLSRADGVIIAVTAPQLLAPESKNSQTQFARLLLQRLRDTVAMPTDIPLIFAITRCDMTGSVNPPAIYQIVDFARELGFSNASHVPVASFSDRPNVPSGMGLASLLDAIFPTSLIVAPECDSPDGTRMFNRFRFGAEVQG